MSANGPGGIGVYYEKTLDISSFAGETIYVAFRHHESSNVFSLEIDNVSVEVGEAQIPSEGCLEVNPARPQYPYVTVSPNCTGELEIFASLARTGEYTKMNAAAGTTYTFTSSVATDFVTIANADGTEILAFGDSGLTWTSDADQEIRYYLHLDSYCNWSGTATRAKRVQCSILPEPEGCLEADGQYPSEAYTPSCIGLAESITEGDYGYFGEYSVVNVTEGTEYTFSALSSDVPTVFITIGNEAGTEVLTSGTDTVTWTATATGAIRFYTHENDECLASNNWVDRIVQCGEVLPPPANDECDGAIALSCGNTETGTTVFANNSGGNESNDVFFSFVGEGTEQMITLSLCGSSYDTAISVYSDCSLTNLVASNDDSANCPEFQSEVSFLSDGTTNYINVVEGFSLPLFGINEAREFELTVTCEELPEFDACAPVFTGGADYAIGFSGGNAIAANDINVLADTQFSVEKIIFDVNAYGGAPTTFDVRFYEGENGVETPYGEIFEGLVPSSMDITGTYAGDPTYTVELTLPTTQILPATGTEDKKYWIAISSDLATDNNYTYWVSSNYLFTETLPIWQSLDGGIT